VDIYIGDRVRVTDSDGAFLGFGEYVGDDRFSFIPGHMADIVRLESGEEVQCPPCTMELA